MDTAQTSKEKITDSRTLLGTGVPGLDSILIGGLAPNRLYLLEGEPGCGKTTLSLQFLMEGVRRGEKVLYITLSETAEELHQVAMSHGWDLSGVDIHEVIPGEEVLSGEETYTVFHPSEIELNEAMRGFLKEIEALRPSRVVLDSLAELRLLAGSALRYRRHVLALKQFFSDRRCTALLIDDRSSHEGDQHVQSVAHGLIVMQQQERQHGQDRRRLRIAKYRATAYRGGWHDFVIRRGGLEVFQRLDPSDHKASPAPRRLASGLASLDELFGGGVETGTSTLLTGAPGTGKSTLAAQFVNAAAERGERAAFFSFDEAPATMLLRTQSLGMKLKEHRDAGHVIIHKIEPAELSPGEFIAMVRDNVERLNATVVVIDSLNGYLQAMPDEKYLIIQLHELLSFLASRGVVTILVSTQSGLIGNNMSSVVDASYLADNVVLLRFFEAEGSVHQAISILKKRGGRHERTIREFTLDQGVHVGDTLNYFRGVLTGVPEYRGDQSALRPKAAK
jgi:circadian clock protein KaiC